MKLQKFVKELVMALDDMLFIMSTTKYFLVGWHHRVKTNQRDCS